MKAALVTIIAAVWLATPCADAGEKHPWAGFKVGSYVKLKTKSVLRGRGADTETITEAKQTLVQLTAEAAVIEFEQSAGGMPPLQNRLEIPFKAEPPDPKAPKPSRTGTETITVAGGTFQCTWSEMKLGDGSAQTTMRIWISDAMPGSLVKSVAKSTIGHGMTSELTAEVVEFLAK